MRGMALGAACTSVSEAPAGASDCIAAAFSASARAQLIHLQVSSTAIMSSMIICQRRG